MVKISGQEVFKAGDLNRFLSGFEVLNPDLEICHMESDVEFIMEISINKGRGYVPAEENKPLDAEFGVIPIDAIFTPIKNVKYSVENYRVE